jgi:hypothetical protein
VWPVVALVSTQRPQVQSGALRDSIQPPTVFHKIDRRCLDCRLALDVLVKNSKVAHYQGALLLQLWTAETYRPTRGLDLLGRGPSDINFRKVFSAVCSQNVEDDGLTFLPDKIRVERIRDEEAYEGVRVRMEARLGNVRVPLQIDVGLGDTIVPASEEVEYPTLLKFPAPKLHGYSKESVVAEKFEAMVKLGVAKSRMKDFYDLWVLAQRFEFESSILAAAIQTTFKKRRTDSAEIVAASITG